LSLTDHGDERTYATIFFSFFPFACSCFFSFYVSCHNPILGYSPKFIFLKNKNKKNKIKAGNVEKVDQEK